jgi:hypothetical protein
MPNKIPSPLTLEPEGQQLADRVIDTLGNRAVLTRHPNLNALADYLDDDYRMVDSASGQEYWIWAPDPDHLVRRLVEFDGDLLDRSEIRSALDALVANAFDGDLGFWGEEPTGPILATISHSQGSIAYLLFEIIDYGEGPYEWHGLFGRPEAAQQHVRDWGRIVTMEDYLAMADDLVARIADELDL